MNMIFPLLHSQIINELWWPGLIMCVSYSLHAALLWKSFPVFSSIPFIENCPTSVRHISSVEGGAAASMMTNKLDKRKDSP